MQSEQRKRLRCHVVDKKGPLHRPRTWPKKVARGGRSQEQSSSDQDMVASVDGILPDMVGLTIAVHNGRRSRADTGFREYGRTQAGRVRGDAGRSGATRATAGPSRKDTGAMQVSSNTSSYARISPQKCRLVADAVRGQSGGNRASARLTLMPEERCPHRQEGIGVRRRECGAQSRRGYR